VAQAVLIKKENGLIIPAESTDFTANTVEGTWTGGLIGSLVGILGGPIGVLLGGATGALIGSDAGTAQTLGEGLLLENTAKKLDNGSTAIIILAQESDEAVLDAFFHRFKTVILRQDAAVAQQDVLAAIEAQEEVARQAHEAWKKQRKAERKEKVEAFKADIKQKFNNTATNPRYVTAQIFRFGCMPNRFEAKRCLADEWVFRLPSGSSERQSAKT